MTDQKQTSAAGSGQDDLRSASRSLKEAMATLTKAIGQSLGDAGSEVRRELADELSAASRELQGGLGDAAAEISRAAETLGSRGTGRRTKSDKTRSDLVEAAVQVFAAQGYEGAGVNDIARAAGYTKGALYANFASKEDLFIAALIESAKGNGSSVAEAAERAPSEYGREATLIGIEAYLFTLRHPGRRPDLEELLRQSLEHIAVHVHSERTGVALDDAAPTLRDRQLAFGFWAIPSMAAIAGPVLGDDLELDEGAAWLSGLLESAADELEDGWA